MKTKKITLCLLVILCSFSVQAKMIKCTDNKGKVSYGTSPCQENKNEDQTIKAKMLQNELDYNSRPETKEMFARESLRVKELAREREAASPLNATNLYNSMLDAKSRGDIAGYKTFENLLKVQLGNANGGSMNQMDTQKQELEDKMQAQKSQMEMNMRAQKSQMEMQMQNEMHRMESQQRLNQAFPPPWQH